MSDYTIKKVSYYNWHPTGVECKDLAQEFDYNIGTAIVYLYRHGKKVENGEDVIDAKIRDIRKAITHCEYEIERLQAMKRNTENKENMEEFRMKYPESARK